jgi:hypothetical protein
LFTAKNQNRSDFPGVFESSQDVYSSGACMHQPEPADNRDRRKQTFFDRLKKIQLLVPLELAKSISRFSVNRAR